MKKIYVYLLIIIILITIFSLLYNKILSFKIYNERSYIPEAGYIAGFIKGNYPYDLAISVNFQKSQNIIEYINLFKSLDDCIIKKEKLDYLEKNFFNYNSAYEKKVKGLQKIKYSRPLAYYSLKKHFSKYEISENLLKRQLKDLIYFKVFVINNEHENLIKKIKEINMIDFKEYPFIAKHYLIYKIFASYYENNYHLSSYDLQILETLKESDIASFNLLKCFFELSNGNIQESLSIFNKIKDEKIDDVILKNFYNVIKAKLLGESYLLNCYEEKLLDIINKKLGPF